MSKNPVNLTARLLMEVAAIISFGMWGLNLKEGWMGIILAILLPLIFASIWGVFAVTGDPSRSGKTVVPTPGPVRLILELVLFGCATWMLFNLGYSRLSGIYGAVVVVHYIVSFDRIRWLLSRTDP